MYEYTLEISIKSPNDIKLSKLSGHIKDSLEETLQHAGHKIKYEDISVSLVSVQKNNHSAQ